MFNWLMKKSDETKSRKIKRKIFTINEAYIFLANLVSTTVDIPVEEKDMLENVIITNRNSLKIVCSYIDVSNGMITLPAKPASLLNDLDNKTYNLYKYYGLKYVYKSFSPTTSVVWCDYFDNDNVDFFKYIDFRVFIEELLENTKNELSNQ